MAEDPEQRKHRIGIQLVEALKDKLTQEHGKHTGIGQGSIKYRIDGDDIVISMEEYLEFLEFGTPNPTTPQEIMSWVTDKIMPTVNVTGKNREKTKQHIAESIAKHITKYGPKPFPFIRQTIAEDLPEILA